MRQKATKKVRCLNHLVINFFQSVHPADFLLLYIRGGNLAPYFSQIFFANPKQAANLISSYLSYSYFGLLKYLYETRVFWDALLNSKSSRLQLPHQIETPFMELTKVRLNLSQKSNWKLLNLDCLEEESLQKTLLQICSTGS